MGKTREELEVQFEFRPVYADEAGKATAIEAASFPESEACTLPEYRGQGIASELMRTLLKSQKETVRKMA